jgi:putative mycofactocin binding protein MftB
MNGLGKKYRLAPGAQAREEEFGLLFYHRDGPRLFWLPCGRLLEDRFFLGKITLEQWIREVSAWTPIPQSRLRSLVRALNRLEEKGVIVDC